MSVICSRCSSRNPKQSAFCAYCGNKLFLNGQVGQFMQSAGNHSVVSTLSPVYTPQQPLFFTVPATAQQQNSVTPIPVSFYQSKVETASKPISIRHALLGRGCITTHYSWLLEGKQMQALLVRSAAMSLFRQHTLPGLKVNVERIWARGLFEEREYIIVQRGISAVFLYIAPVGRDLYISRTTMISPAISSIRVTICITLLFLLFIGFVLSSSMQSFAYAPYSYIGDSFYNTLLSSLTMQYSIPLFTLSLLTLCLIVCIRSCIHWFVEKDPWLSLRSNHLNAFQIDDIVFLEQTADRIIHNAVKQLGLDATAIVPPPLGYQHKQRIRSI